MEEREKRLSTVINFIVKKMKEYEQLNNIILEKVD